MENVRFAVRAVSIMEEKDCLVRSSAFVCFLWHRYCDGNFFVINPITSKTNPVDMAASAALKAGQ